MQRRGDRTLFSASDLVAFLECQHRTTLDVINLETPMERAKDSDEAKLVQDKGFEHEGSYLESLRAAGVTVADLGGDDSNDKKIAATEAALAEGAEIIYQATLTSGHWIGHTDFLRRIETPSALGAWSYEVADTKLAHHAKPKFLIQLAFYSDLLGQAQGLVPKQMHLVLGDRSEHSYRLADFTHYYQRLKQRFEDFVATRPETYPEQCDACGFCPWRDRCAEQWRQDDHLNGVAGISKVQIKKLRHSGVTTLAQLAGLAPSASLPRMQPDTLSRLRAQAALQLSKRETGHDQLELLPRTQGSGFRPATTAGCRRPVL